MRLVVAAGPAGEPVSIEAVPGAGAVPVAPTGQPGAALGARGAASRHHAPWAGPALLAHPVLAW